jgi:hypothetical protein
MRKTIFSTLALACVAGLGLITNAHAQSTAIANPGSLLVYPLFDNTRGALTFITVTNTSATTGIFAHFVYVNANPCGTTVPPAPNCCQEQDRPHYLTPLDTITVNSRFDNPNAAKGYLFVFARQVAPGSSPPQPGPNAVKFDHLIGTEWVFEPNQDLLSINPFVYKAAAGLAELANTDVNPANGKRDLNGNEYGVSPDILEFPRFWGQLPPPSFRQSELILLNMTGGAQFLAHTDILLYDNDESQFSAAHDFVCWTRVPLSTTGNPTGISAFFDHLFLLATSDASELNGTFGITSGWFTVDGTSANSTQTQLSNPAILGVLLDNFAAIALRSAEIPFGEGTNANGRLLSHTLMGD